MIAPPDSTSQTMLEAIAVTLGALVAASELDVDRTDADRAFLTDEHTALKGHFDAVEAKDQALRKHRLLVSKARQAAIVIGDEVLDRGVRASKRRMALELKHVDPNAVDHVYPSDIRDIVDAEKQVEPQLVLEVAAKYGQVPDFTGKTELKADLEGRATRQKKGFEARAAGEVTESELEGALEKAVRDGANALYGLEKRLFERFSRETVYVRAFFMDVAPARKKKKGEEPAAGGGAGGAAGGAAGGGAAGGAAGGGAAGGAAGGGAAAPEKGKPG